ncbi:MAG: amidohydrolase family protein [Deltaproteobacteria bacterium]|nr:amidohydrolase family protein [Deltaproteobacteria bacterium]
MTTIFLNRRVRTFRDDGAAVDALVVCDGRVVASGDAPAMRSLAGAAAEVVELRGAALLPGLIDTHPHLMHFGVLAFPLVDLADAMSHDDIVARIATRAASTPAGEWIMTTPVGEPHYFLRRSYRDLAEGTLPDRAVLDRATTRHPVMIQAWAPVIPNVCALNSAALARLGITRQTPDQVEHVWIEKDRGGEPIGILRGSVTNYYTGDAFMNGLLRQLPLLQPTAIVPGTINAMARYNALGVTTVYEGHAMEVPLIETYRMLRDQGALSVRVLAAPEVENYSLPWDGPLSLDEFAARLEQARAMVDVRDDLFRVSGVTLSRGGPCWPGFLLMREPYRGPYGEPTTGVSFVSAEKAALAMDFCARHDLRLNVIVAGTGEHAEYLTQLEAVAAQRDIRARHWILQHAFFVEPSAARRYAALGMDVTTSMSFSWGKGDLFLERIGTHVLEHLIPLRRLLDAGMTVACGSDWGPKNIFEHIQLALTHRFAVSGRSNLGPAQRVTRTEALAMWMRDAARVLQWDGIGTLGPGDHADLVIVDRDPLECALDDLPGTRVLRTVLGGRTVYDAGAL